MAIPNKEGFQFCGTTANAWGSSAGNPEAPEVLGNLVMFGSNPYNQNGKLPMKMGWDATGSQAAQPNGWRKMIQREKKKVIDEPWRFKVDVNVIHSAIRIPYYLHEDVNAQDNDDDRFSVEHLLIGYCNSKTQSVHAGPWNDTGTSDLNDLGGLMLRHLPRRFALVRQVAGWQNPGPARIDNGPLRWEFRCLDRKVVQAFQIPVVLVDNAGDVNGTLWHIFVAYEGGAAY